MTFLRSILTTLAIAAACNSPSDPVELDAEVPLTDAHPEGVIYAFGAPTQKLFPNVAATTVFGTAVAIEQDTLVIGATVESNNQGRLYVFVRSGSTWVLQQKLQASDPTNGVRFGIQVDISGNTLIAGSAGEAGNQLQGAAYVFTRSGSTWTQQQKITAPDGQLADRFGQSVRLSGDTAVIGAPGDDDQGSAAGSAYVFVRSGTTWSQQQKLVAVDGAANDQFGYGVTIEGNTVAIGSRRDDDGATDAGSVYVFTRSGTTWSQQQKLTSDSGPDGNFGRDLSLSKETLLIGALQRSGGNGAAYVFVRSGTTWSQQAKLIASDGANQDFFGADVSLFGDLAAVGARLDDDGGNNTGSIYLFKRSGTTWTQTEKIKPSDGQAEDRFSQDFDLFGTTLVGGSRGDDDLAGNSGAAYVFESPIVTNGSFETADYTGWTLLEAPTSPASGTFGIASDGQVIGPSGIVHDFADNVDNTQSSPGLPITYDATDGTQVALHLQTNAQNHRMFQTVTLLAGCGSRLRWDMAYNNHVAAAPFFDATGQFFAINLRDPATDAILATPFKTQDPAPTVVSAMTPFDIDLSAFDGQTVRLDFEHQVQNFFFDIAWDNIRIVCTVPPVPVINVSPAPHNFGNQPVNTTSANQTFTITNAGTADLVITSISTSAPFAVTPGTLPATVAPGANLTFTGQFAPTATGTANGTISIASNVGGSPTLVSVTGTGTAPAISVAPSPHSFGNQPVNTTSANQTFTITNAGTADLVITSISTSAPFAVTTGTLPATVAPGANLTFTGRFAPTATGVANGTISIASNVSGSPTLVSVTGTGTEAAISVAPSPHDFGNQLVNTTSANQTFTITNPGTANLVITSITTSAPFAVTPGSLPATVTPGNNRTFTGRFAPTATGVANGTISIASNVSGSPTLVSVTGTGTAPAISVAPSPHDFGDQRVTTTSASQTFTITNTGTANLVLTAITTSAPFAVTPGSLPATVTPGNTRTFTGRFAPTATGVANGTISIASNVSGSPTLVSVTGNGTAPAISVAPSPHDFGTQRVGTTSAGQDFTITNTGTATLNVSAITTTGPFATANTTFAIAPSASQNISVTFGPTAVGLASGTLRITHDAVGSPSVVNLSGTGVQPAISLSPSPLAFGSQRVGTTSGAATLTISNPGTDTLDISAITTTGPFATANTPISVPAGGSQAISVTFTPSVVGAASGSVVITHDAPGSPSSVVATGTGVEPRIDVSPGSLAFGDQRVGTTSGAQTFDISNPGTSDLTITAITVGAPFATTTTLPIVVGAGTSTTISVTFAPQTAGAASDTISITSDASGTNTVSVSGTGVEPVVAVSDLNVGDVRIGTTGNTALAVTNTGTSTLTLTSLVATAPFGTTETFPIVIAPNESKNLNITFSPTVSGTVNDTLTVASDAASSPNTVNVTGRGVEPLATPDLASLDFGLQRVGVTSLTRSVVLTNTGTFPLAVGTISVDAPFTVLTSGNAVVQPSQSLKIDVTFTPSVIGIATQTLAIAHDATGAPTTIALTGTGTLAELDVSPATLAFGDIRIGTASASQQVTIRNLGLAPLSITAITPSAGFIVSGFATPHNVLPNAAVTFEVAFVPGAPGSATGTIEIATPVGTATVMVGGAAVTSALAADRTALDLGTVPLGEASEVQLVQLTNHTDAPITIGSSTLSDPQFVLDPAPSTAPIPPGGSIMFGARFVPGNGGTALGQVDISLAGETAVELSVQLTGRGLVEEGGCCSTGGGGGSSSLLLGLVVLGVLVPRRRRR